MCRNESEERKNSLEFRSISVSTNRFEFLCCSNVEIVGKNFVFHRTIFFEHDEIRERRKMLTPDRFPNERSKKKREISTKNDSFFRAIKKFIEARSSVRFTKTNGENRKPKWSIKKRKLGLFELDATFRIFCAAIGDKKTAKFFSRNLKFSSFLSFRKVSFRDGSISIVISLWT